MNRITLLSPSNILFSNSILCKSVHINPKTKILSESGYPGLKDLQDEGTKYF
jgi:hypothetical protein